MPHYIQAYGRHCVAVNDLPRGLAKVFLHEIDCWQIEGMAAPALFDLYATAAFISQDNSEWVHCESENKYVRPYMNSCPACAAKGRFVHLDGYKPKSHALGRLDRALAIIFSELIRRTGNNGFRVYLPTKRHTDMLLVDEQMNSVFACEIKCGSLITLPMVAEAPAGVCVEGGSGHTVMKDLDASTIFPSLLMPRTQGRGSVCIPLGVTADLLTPDNVEAVLINAVCHKKDVLEQFVGDWTDLLGLYVAKDKTDIAAFQINGCGRPPVGLLDPSWPRKGKRLYKEISNGKTTIGLSRSDDIKKAGGQLNRMHTAACAAFPKNWKIRSAIVSNLSQFHMQHYIDDVCSQRHYSRERGVERALHAILTLDSVQIDEKRLQNTFSWAVARDLTPVHLEFGTDTPKLHGSFNTPHVSHLLDELEETRKASEVIYGFRMSDDKIVFMMSAVPNAEELRNFAQMAEYLEDWVSECETRSFRVNTNRLRKNAILMISR